MLAVFVPHFCHANMPIVKHKTRTLHGLTFSATLAGYSRTLR